MCNSSRSFVTVGRNLSNIHSIIYQEDWMSDVLVWEQHAGNPICDRRPVVLSQFSRHDLSFENSISFDDHRRRRSEGNSITRSYLSLRKRLSRCRDQLFSLMSPSDCLMSAMRITTMELTWETNSKQRRKKKKWESRTNEENENMSIKQEKLTRRHEIFTTIQANGIKRRKHARATVWHAHIGDVIAFFSIDPSTTVLSLIFASAQFISCFMFHRRCSYPEVVEISLVVQWQEVPQCISFLSVGSMNERISE